MMFGFWSAKPRLALILVWTGDFSVSGSGGHLDFGSWRRYVWRLVSPTCVGVLVGLRVSCPNASFKPLAVWLLTFYCASSYRTITVGVTDSATTEAPTNQSLIPEGHPDYLTFRTDNWAAAPESFVQWDLHSYTQESGLIWVYRFAVYLHELTDAPTNIASSLLIYKMKGQSPYLDPKWLLCERDIPHGHSFLPPSKRQEMIVKTPWPVVAFHWKLEL